MFNKVLVLDTNRKPLMPCHPRRARKLLKSGRASVFRRYPFTIIVHDRTVEESVLQDVEIKVDHRLKPLIITAVGRGSRQFCRMNKYGFPRTKAKPRTKNFFGFKTGDMVRAIVPVGARTKIPTGIYVGRVAVRSNGRFDIKTKDSKTNISHKYCKPIHLMDGYSYD